MLSGPCVKSGSRPIFDALVANTDVGPGLTVGWRSDSHVVAVNGSQARSAEMMFASVTKAPARRGGQALPGALRA